MGTPLSVPGGKPASITSKEIEIPCVDEQLLHGHLFEPNQATEPKRENTSPRQLVVIACATGVRASYYHRYATFLAEHGFTALTFDYRGIGASAPADLRDFTARWHQWGTEDIDAAVRWARNHQPDGTVSFVGHSFGGFGVGLSPEAHHLARILTVGAQHAYWRDYAKGYRAQFLTRWHLYMPLMTRASGYFRGKRRGWLEDLPRGVALDWARSRKDFIKNAPAGQQTGMRAAGQALRTPILALATTDDPYASVRAMKRALAYTPQAPTFIHRLEPRAYGKESIGHFGLFHSDYAESFWSQTLIWLRDGIDPWAEASGPLEDPQERPLRQGSPAGKNPGNRPATSRM